MSVGEDKENLMKKPSRIPAKTTKVTKSLSDKDSVTVRQPFSSNKSKITRSCSNQSLDKWPYSVSERLIFVSVGKRATGTLQINSR